MKKSHLNQNLTFLLNLLNFKKKTLINQILIF